MCRVFLFILFFVFCFVKDRLTQSKTFAEQWGSWLNFIHILLEKPVYCHCLNLWAWRQRLAVTVSSYPCMHQSLATLSSCAFLPCKQPQRKCVRERERESSTFFPPTRPCFHARTSTAKRMHSELCVVTVTTSRTTQTHKPWISTLDTQGKREKERKKDIS